MVTGDGVVREVLIVAGLMMVQVIYAVYMLVLKRFLADGISPLFIVIFGSLVSAVVLLPFAIVLERKKWPKRFSFGLMAQFGLIAIGGVVIFQALMLLGVKKSSPAIASAMPNLAPGFIFTIAACVRFEKFAVRCKYSRAKILGTLVCLGGAVAMSFMQSPPSVPAVKSTSLDAAIFNDWILGCFYLLAAILVLSAITVLQATTMVGFPAPFSLCVITSLIGSPLTAILQIVMEGRLDVGTSTMSMRSIICFVILGGTVTSICAAFQTWCVNEKGPVLVSIFSPVQTVCSTVLSAIILRQVVGVGSLAGMLLMFSGLYIVLWAKKKEDCIFVAGDDNTTVHDVEKPLLS